MNNKKEVDFEELSEKYMVKYNEMVDRSNSLEIKNIIDDINRSIKTSNIQNINENYTKILDWNFYVGNIEGAQKAINGQFTFLHLPSASMFTIVYDENEKEWRFNTDAV